MQCGAVDGKMGSVQASMGYGMARPREFDEDAVLDAAVQCFWGRGYEATSVRDLIDKTGLTAASLYNAFGDKRAFYQRALEHYVDGSIAARIRRCEVMEPREAISAFFGEILSRSLGDREHKGCMLVNAALDVAPHDPGLQEAVAEVLIRIEAFFRQCVSRGQADGTIRSSLSAEDLARHLLGVLMGVRILARVRPDRALLEGVVGPALALLDLQAHDAADAG
jgi:TetR/AcrR family transcriptional repressor of nem operon